MADEVVVETNFDELADFFGELEEDTTKTKLNEFWRTTQNYIQRQTLLRFRRQHSPEGVPWAALSPLTIAWRRVGRKGSSRGAKILQDTGEMMRHVVSDRAVTEKTDRKLKISAKGVVPVVQQLGARWRISGSQAWWMALHLIAHVPPGGKPETPAQKNVAQRAYQRLVGRFMEIVARPFLGFSAEDILKIPKIWTDWFDGNAKDAAQNMSRK